MVLLCSTGHCGIILLDMTAGHCAVIVMGMTAGHCAVPGPTSGRQPPE